LSFSYTFFILPFFLENKKGQSLIAPNWFNQPRMLNFLFYFVKNPDYETGKEIRENKHEK